MRRFFAATCFLISMFPAWASAEKPVGYPSDTPAERKGSSASFLAERNEEYGIRLVDSELFLVKGKAVKTGMPQVLETGERRVVLWDEGNGNTDTVIRRGSGQSMITIRR
ncbi:MAG TPA: hypothetical protein VF790_02645 [Dissulfurispiraceae bacterium]